MPSCYKPPIVCWKSDLSNGGGPGNKRRANYIACATDNYLEIYRKRKIIGPYIGFFLFGSGEILLISLFFYFLTELKLYWFMAIIYFFASIGLGLVLYFTLFTLLFGHYAPVSNPIRFNRKTGKVYLYEAVAMKWMFKAWPPRRAFKDLNKFHIKVYDWENFHGVLQG
ncbi:DUF6708 domain-containing protein, partial [Gilliamella sp. wkB308]